MFDKSAINIQIASVLKDVPKGSVGIAVSGGGDSVALLRLLHKMRKEHGREVYVATVNHNLRAEAHAEAEFVAELCGKLGVPHVILNWEGWDGQGNMQNAARNARKSLLTGWARDLELTAIALGHTRDDQAETFLLRLARGSGVDGLSGMKQIAGYNPVWVRPLLDVSRKELRVYLRDLGQKWIDDPSNDDDRFDRIKMRKAMPELAKLGLTTDRLASTAVGLQAARKALEIQTQTAVRECCVPDRFGTVAINIRNLQKQALEIQYRVFSHAISWVSGATYRPRFSALKEIYSRLQQGKSQTLAGCYIKVIANEQAIVMRELNNMAFAPLEKGCFDDRWDVFSEESYKGAEIRPLGEKGLLQVENWRDLDVLRDILLQTPAAWVKDTVISAPFAGFAGPVRMSLKIDQDQFYSNVVSR